MRSQAADCRARTGRNLTRNGKDYSEYLKETT